MTDTRDVTAPPHPLMIDTRDVTAPPPPHLMTDSGDVSVPRENENLITSFIDGSNVYGSTEERQERLRDSRRSKVTRSDVPWARH